MYVSDTHSFVYYAQGKSRQLGKRARQLFIEADDGKTVIYIPALVLWEIWMLVKSGDFRLPMRFDHWCRALDTSPGFAVAPLGWQVVEESRHFPFKDPFDCLIAGTAMHLGMPLITKDREIENCGLIATVW